MLCQGASPQRDTLDTDLPIDIVIKEILTGTLPLHIKRSNKDKIFLTKKEITKYTLEILYHYRENIKNGIIDVLYYHN